MFHEQEHMNDILTQEEALEKHWQALFNDPRSDTALARMVEEALAEDEAGETEEIIGDSFLS
ncbi:MAG TPA: hypothetical protein DHW02_02520 [Ktedonobacter sp.]|jgi:hypothetical protein|nr:hypothetical protein [Ktedonobacter sp.]